ncbi:MAG: hypothetical protein H6813_04100 [Phycisphaeraceae bacterium]|nr:hypothetical protein [Phycisphaeraceae bacterium]MCB9847129.1 hypothetical protein [Phycisphaeraceae bacterium]
MNKRANRTMCFWSGGVAAAGAARPARRGVALMLVVVALGTATVLTTAYLMSKDNSAEIGANAQDTSASAWAARSGADVALAVLQTEADWVDADPEKLLEGYSIAGGTVTVALTDLEGNPPDGTETELAMTVVSNVNGVRTVLQRLVAMRPDATLDEAVDPEYEEFGVFATQSMNFSMGSKLAPWPLSEAYKSGAPVKMMAGFTSSADLTMDADLNAMNSELYLRPDSSAALQTLIDSGKFAGGKALAMSLPAVPARLPAALASGLAVIQSEDLKIDTTDASTTLVGGEYQRLDVLNDSVTVTLDDSTGGLYHFTGDVVLDTNAVLQVKGDVSVRIDGKFNILNGSTVVLADDTSRVRFYVQANMCVKNAGIGVPPAVAARTDRSPQDLEGLTNDPRRIKVYGMTADDHGTPGSTIELRDNSIGVLCIVAPVDIVSVTKGATVVGRLTGKMVKVSETGTLFYEPMMDDHRGFTAFTGPYYKSNGDPLDGLCAALASYDMTQGLDLFTAHIKAHSVVEIDAIPVPGPGDPTPRTEGKAKEKPWPFVAKAIEEGITIPSDNSERQEGLYVPLDPTIFDLDQFYNNGVIVATYAHDADNVVDEVVDAADNLVGGLGKLK